MTGTDFLLFLHEMMPPRAELEADGLSPERIEDIQATFRSVPRKPSGSSARSELEKMIIENDCSTVEFGFISFLDRPLVHRHGIQVAYHEADPIVVTPAGTIAMYDHEDPDFVIVNCAADSERFLDALSTYLAIRQDKSKWKGRNDAAVALCAEKAGGREYAKFSQVLCGFR